MRLNVVLFNYLSRRILEVFLSRRFVGVAGPYPESGRANMSGIDIDLGVQNASRVQDGLGYPDSGKNAMAAKVVRLDMVPSEARYLGLHIYPDNTVELLCSRHFPELREQGEVIDHAWREANGR